MRRTKKIEAGRKKLTKEREKREQELFGQLRQKADRECSVVEERAADKADALRRSHAQAEAEDKQRAEQEVDNHRATQGKLRIKAARDVLDTCGVSNTLEEFLSAANGSTQLPVNTTVDKFGQALQDGLERLQKLKEAAKEAQEEFEDKQIELQR